MSPLSPGVDPPEPREATGPVPQQAVPEPVLEERAEGGAAGHAPQRPEGRGVKAPACSWRHMRKVKYILANAERLKGEAEALMRCSDKATRSHWRRAIDVMEAVGFDIETGHVLPSHATEIARHAPRESWPRWVARCEAEQLTVPALRGALMAEQADRVPRVVQSADQVGDGGRPARMTRAITAILRGWSVCCLYAQHPACRVAGCPCACHRVMERSAA